jgi:hypothetical protein
MCALILIRRSSGSTVPHVIKSIISQTKGILQEISAELKFCFVHIFDSAHPTLCISFVIIFLSEDIS